MSETPQDSWIGFFLILCLLAGLGWVIFDKLSQKPYDCVATETSAIAQTRAIFQAQQQFRILKKATILDPRDAKKTLGRFARTFGELNKYDLLDLKPPYQKNCYQFEMRTSKSGLAFEAVAYPLPPEAGGSSEGERSFYVNESGTITFSTNGVRPNAKSPKLDG